MNDRPRPTRLLTQGDIEEQILGLCAELEEETYRYAELSDLAVEAEADYKEKSARALVSLANMDRGETGKMTVGERTARIEDVTADQYRLYRIQEARRQASREALLSLRSRLDALRTLSANVRHQT